MHACDHMIQIAEPCGNLQDKLAMSDSDSSGCEEESVSCPGPSQAKKAKVEKSLIRPEML